MKLIKIKRCSNGNSWNVLINPEKIIMIDIPDKSDNDDKNSYTLYFDFANGLIHTDKEGYDKLKVKVE